MKLVQRTAALCALLIGSLVASGCTTTLVLTYVHEKLTEGDPPLCGRLNSVERALSQRCGNFVPGSLLTKDVTASGLPMCPLTLAARNPRFWPVLPELLSHGAQPEVCLTPPLVALAQAQSCPDFAGATRESLQALRWLAGADARSIHHDVMRMLSCPNARVAGLVDVLDGWLAQGLLPAREIGFSPLGALHPDYLHSSFAAGLEAAGHSARAAFGPHPGQLAPGFEEALRGVHFGALDWWLHRLPELANRVPPSHSNQLAWLPLAQAITPGFMPDADQQRETVIYLLARGADPDRALPHERGRSVLDLARQLNSPLLALLEAPRLSTASRSLAAGGALAAGLGAPAR